MIDMRIKKLAQTMIHYSTSVQPGEQVFIRATSPAAEPLVQALYQEILRVGASPFPYIHLRDDTALALQASNDAGLLAAVNPMLELMYQNCDVIFYIEAAENPRALSDYPLELQKAILQGHRTLINIQMKRLGDESMRRCSSFFPTRGYAQRAGMALPQFEEFFYRGCKVHLDDPITSWRESGVEQQRLIDYLAGKKHLQIRGENIELEMSIEERTFINAGATENYPGSEIFTSPVENSVNGWVKFTYPAYWGDNAVEGIELTFEHGLVTQAKAATNENWLLSVLETDPGARRLGEFAIGTNYDIQRFTGMIVFDEKIGGTIHIAVGQGFPQAGSVNTSTVHWDMIYDMRNGGEIWVDGTLFYQKGLFII